MADFSVYPNAIDGYAQIPLVVDNVTRVDAVTVNRLRCAIVNIETELGILPSGTFTDVRARLDALELAISNLGTVALGYKNPARTATNSNIPSLSSGAPLIVSGVNVAAGDRVLVWQQANMEENGIYTVDNSGNGSNGSWSRSDDANDDALLIPGTEVFVVEGDHASCKFWLITPGPYVIGTTQLEFVGGLSLMKSDSAPTVILAATSIGFGESNATPTNSISVSGFKEIDFSFLVGDLGSITDLRARVIYSLLENPGAYASSPEDWNILLAEDISSGLATIDAYTLSLDTTLYPDFSSLPGSFAFRSPVSGLHMMVVLWSETGAVGGSSFEGRTLRRI